MYNVYMYNAVLHVQCTNVYMYNATLHVQCIYVQCSIACTMYKCIYVQCRIACIMYICTMQYCMYNVQMYICTMQNCMYIQCIHVLMRDEKGRKKEASKVKQTARQSNTAHPRQSLFLRKMSCLGWDSNVLNSKVWTHVGVYSQDQISCSIYIATFNVIYIPSLSLQPYVNWY